MRRFVVYKINRLFAVFDNPKDERAYRIVSHYERLTEIKSTLIIGTIFVLIFCIIEFFANTEISWMVMVKVGSITVVVLTLMGTFIRARPGNRYWLVSGVEILALIALSMIAYLNRSESLFVSIGFILYLLGVYLYIPNLFLNSLSLGVLATLIFFYIIDQSGLSDSSGRVYLSISMLLINIFSAKFSNGLHCLHRREFGELMSELEAKIQLNVEIQNRRNLESELRKQASTDPLTGASTRNHFIEIVDHQIDLAKRYGQNFHLLLMDMDGFKQINDRFGHLAGDEVLALTADICRSVLRKSDILCRYGGDEFALMIPDADTEGVMKLSSRICVEIDETSSSIGRHVTVSMGIVKFDSSMSKIRDMIACADQALYLAKESGKNRAQLCTPRSLIPPPGLSSGLNALQT